MFAAENSNMGKWRLFNDFSPNKIREVCDAESLWILVLFKELEPPLW